MLIDDRGFELGMPSREEMIRHQVVLLKHEREDAWLRLAKANEDIQRLIEINEQLNRQVTDLQRQLNHAYVEYVHEENRRKYTPNVSSWNMRFPTDTEVAEKVHQANEKTEAR